MGIADLIVYVSSYVVVKLSTLSCQYTGTHMYIAGLVICASCR